MRRSMVMASLGALALSACEPALDSSSAGRPITGAPEPVIVHFTRGVDLPARAAAGRAGRLPLIAALRADAAAAQGPVRALLHQHGIEPRGQLWMINALAVTLPADLRAEIAQRPEVERIEPDLSLQASTSPASTATATSWNLQAVRAPELWAVGQQGAGTVVATLDTGVDPDHPDLAGAWRSLGGWYDPYGEHATPFDSSGHGTQVTGLVVGGDASGQPIGVAPGAQWIGAKIYDDAGVSTVSGIHLALQWTLDPDGNPDTDDAADVVNGSWGYSQLVNQCYLEFETDLATLRAAQVAVVFAAGNNGPTAASSISPANNPSGFAAGAVDSTLAVVASSGRGPDACTGALYPELAAPGAEVQTTDRTFNGQFPQSYVTVSGTSFAAPHVAGAMAILLGAHPTATVAQLEAALTGSAVDLGQAGPDDDSGYGLPDLVAAETLLAALVSTPSCTDGDGDGYFVEPDCGSALDCDDGDWAINPGACDIKGDGIDQDCDGADRAKGKPCLASGGGTVDAGTGGGTSDAGSGGGSVDAGAGSPENKRKSCTDGIDNDLDGLIDCADPDCAGIKGC